MATNRSVRYARYERKLHSVRKAKYQRQLALHGTMIVLIMVIGFKACLVQAMDKCQVVNSNVSTTGEVVQTTTVEQMAYEQVPQQDKSEYNKNWSAEDNYLLAKIVMAEAEGCNKETKTLVAMVVLNRVQSDQFPDTIYDVIFQRYNGTYQFSPIGNGRWDSVEPNGDCYEAVEAAKRGIYDHCDGALYFESCANKDNWHSRNLEYICESEGVRFYK